MNPSTALDPDPSTAIVYVPVPVDRLQEVYWLLSHPRTSLTMSARFPRHANFAYVLQCKCGKLLHYTKNWGNALTAVKAHAETHNDPPLSRLELTDVRNRLCAQGGGEESIDGWALAVTPLFDS